ncbi:MAG: SIMPL domain-containing protein [Steroidobacteraceae bacterium]|jgi:hypothetical protein|nr:SIMPL domain-containing protein [Steroidobacteraceae bacterium]
MDSRLVAAVVLALGVALAGWWVGSGFAQGRAEDRYVTVKGVAEREVEADLALWPMQFVVADDDLGRAQSRMQETSRKVREFLVGQGFQPAEIALQDLSVTDTQANRYGGQPATFRFVVSQTLMVRTDRPQVLFDASQKVGELIEAGVVLSSDGPWAGGPTYLFTTLNDLKPAMIAEATANARAAAEQFAQDSGSPLGPIRRANQGLFVILPRDQAPGVQEERQRAKVVRVVTTVEYLLGD